MRSLTEVFTNQTAFLSPDLSEALAGLLDPGAALPASSLPTILHEGTHHWCFSSSVGTTLALLGMRGRLRALEAAEAEEPTLRAELERRSLEDLARSALTIHLMKPLAEGLACFAEFDANPKLRSPALPAPLRWAVLACNPGLLTTDPDANWVTKRKDAFARTEVDLMDARGAMDVGRRRIELLQQPLTCASLPATELNSGKEGYLAGYLYVKNLWRRAERLDDYMRLVDFFLLFAHEYFYEDEVLVDLLLDETLAVPESLNRLVHHLDSRLMAPFIGAFEGPNVESFRDRHVESRKSAHDAGDLLFPANPGDRKPQARHLELWSRVLGDFPKAPPKEPLGAEAFGFLAGKLLMGRDLLYLGGVPVHAVVGREWTTVTMSDGQALALRSDPLAPIGEHAGTAALCLGTRSGRHVVYVVSKGLRLLAMRVSPECTSEDEAESFRDAVLGREAVALCDMQIEIADPKIQELGKLRDVNAYIRQTDAYIDGLYEPGALCCVPEPALPEAIVKARRDGIFGLLDERADLLRAVALMRRGAGLVHHPETLRREFAALGIDLETVIRDLAKYEQKYRIFGFQHDVGISCTL